MTETEITLFKELIRETVRSVLKEEKFKMAEEVKKSFAKDLKEIKLLIAKQIKEGRERPVTNTTRIVEQRVEPGKAGAPLPEERSKALRNILSGMGMAPAPSAAAAMRNLKESKLDTTTKSILMQTARDMTEEDTQALNENFVDSDDQYEDRGYSLPNNVEEEYQPKYANGLPPQRNI